MSDDAETNQEFAGALANIYNKIPGSTVSVPGAGFSSTTTDAFGEIPERKWEGQPCRPGYICEEYYEVSCEELRQNTIDIGLGDIHAGAYCPGNESNRESVIYENCEIGFYCPNSTSKIPCPAGFYCPWKTAEPTIRCVNCSEGSTIMNRNLTGFLLIIFIPLCVIGCMSFVFLRRQKKLQKDTLADLQRRKVDANKIQQDRKEREEKLRRLRPKLQRLQVKLKEHLQKLQEESNDDRSVISFESEEGDPFRSFDPARVFDAIDSDKSGDLTYDELNAILDLNSFQLREFIRRMNHLAGLPSDYTTISRSVFHMYFLPVLEISSHFAPTEDEVEDLFDDIAEKMGSDRDGDIFYKHFYLSSLTDFLSDAQINDLIKRFQRIRATTSEREPIGDDSGRRGSIFRLRKEKATRGSTFLLFNKSRVSESYRQPPQQNARRPSMRRPSLIGAEFGGARRQVYKHNAISRSAFIEHYPQLLLDILGSPVINPSADVVNFRIDDDDESLMRDEEGVDMAFENLSLDIRVGDHAVTVVDHVSGRLESGTMTAVMGGSGAGKTSLLNALCGRAFYGEIDGTIKINGHKATSVEQYSSSVGFVPQDDIVYGELTVRENFMFAGQFTLPSGTPYTDIEDLADATMANLGLSRVGDTIVGDVHRRGVSGGEKKRVNIGVELMSKPSILFLDEPTSGLDASSALLVTKSIKNLVTNRGVTVACVIHQPRKIIYELFDRVILLGEGGKMVFHGYVSDTENYFKEINYDIPPGESLADWLIDISSGRLAPKSKMTKLRRAAPTRRRVGRGRSKEGSGDLDLFLDPTAGPGGPPGGRRSRIERSNSIGSMDSGMQSQDEELGGGNLFNDAAMSEVGIDGLSAQQYAKARDMAKIRRDKLYRRWIKYFKRLSKKKKAMYEAPAPYALPAHRKKPSFLKQLIIHLRRHALVAKRNWLSKLVDTTVIVGAVIVISFLDGVVEPTRDVPPNVNFNELISNSNPPLDELFAFARGGYFSLLEYALKVGVVVAVLVGLSAQKILTEKRLEFFREASNGYNVNAYFLAVNIVATVEHTIQVVIAAVFALQIRNSITNGMHFFVNFVMLSWLCVSWAMLFPIILPAKNVVVVTGFFMSFFSLLFSGGIAPVYYQDIYENKGLALFCGFFSPARYFIESLAVSESRCLPTQSGFTNLGDSAPDEAYSFYHVGAGLNDFDNVTVYSCRGWYWGVLPAFLVGVTLRVIAAGSIHFFNRGKQGKRPMLQKIRGKLKNIDPKLPCMVISYTNVVIALIIVSAVFILKTNR